MDKIFWAQHEKLDQSSYLFLNSDKIENLETLEAQNAVNLIMSTKGLLEKKQFKNHSTLKEIRFFEYGYVIAGHLIERDEKGRRIVYNCFMPLKEINSIDSYIFNIVKYKLQKNIYQADLNKIKKVIQEKKKANSKILALIIISIFLIIILIYLI